MDNQLISASHINFLLVFIEGLFSFFSPCVIPLIPVYLSYLAGSAKQTAPDGTTVYRRKTVFGHTVCFVLGISFAFFILGLSFSALGTFFNSNKALFTRIGGLLIIVLGLFQLGVFELRFLKRDYQFMLRLQGRQMNPAVAFVMGFCFSFAWTPCVGPALSSVLILASSAKNALTGNLLVLVYALGFVLPFLLLGLFTTRALSFLRAKQKLLGIIVKAGGVLLILIGVITLTGFMNGVSGYLSSFAGSPSSTASSAESSSMPNSSSVSPEQSAASSSGETEPLPAFDFTLLDQSDTEHTLSAYKGKVVFLNFWATWCPPCQEEMPAIQELYEAYGSNSGDVVFLGVANPKTDTHPRNSDISVGKIRSFIAEKGYTFPTVLDLTGDVFADYAINAFPTTFMIDKQGNIYGYIASALNKETMESIIQMTLDGAPRS